MVAVMVPAEAVDDLKVVVGGLRNVINTTKPLHWVDHFTPKPQHAARRSLASRLVAAIPGAKVVYVVAHKSTLIASQSLRADRDLFYNYVTKLLLERVAFAAERWDGGSRLAIVRLGDVKNMDHVESLRYLNVVRESGRTRAPFKFIMWPPRWYGPDRFDGLQLADLYAGMLLCALRGDPADPGCAAYLLEHRHQIRRSPSGDIFGWGIKLFGDARYLKGRAWWADLHR